MVALVSTAPVTCPFFFAKNFSQAELLYKKRGTENKEAQTPPKYQKTAKFLVSDYVDSSEKNPNSATFFSGAHSGLLWCRTFSPFVLMNSVLTTPEKL